MYRHIGLLMIFFLSIFPVYISNGQPISLIQKEWQYEIELPMKPDCPPGKIEGTFKYGGEKWIVGEKGKGSGTWSFVLPGGKAFESVTIEVTVYNRGEHNWAGYQASYFGTKPEAVDQEVGVCWWNSVPKEGGSLTYSKTFDNVNAPTIYFKHAMENNWFPTAQQLNRVKITVRPVVKVGQVDCEWTRLATDGGGYVITLAMDKSHPDTVYCGSDKGGIHRSDDGGQTWKIIANGFTRETDYAVSTILVDDRNPGRVFIGSGTGWARNFPYKGGVWRSDDKGEHWRQVTTEFYFSGEGDAKMGGHVLEFDPKDHNVIYAGSVCQGVWVTRDAGEHWSQLGLAGKSMTGIWVDPDDSNRILTSARTDVFADKKEPGALYESTDAGKTWKKLINEDVSDISRHERDHNLLAAAVGGKIMISRDRGKTWEKIGLHVSCTGARKVRWHIGKDNRLWSVGGEKRGIFYTDDFGKTWTWPTEDIEKSFRYPKDWFSSARHTDWTAMTAVADMLIDPTRPDRMYTCDFYTVILSEDGGKTWSQKPKGINTLCAYQNVCDPVDPNTIYSLNADCGLLKSIDDGKNFFWPIKEGEFTVNETHQLWVSPENNQHLVVTVTYDWKNPHWTRVGVSKDGGLTWSSYGDGLPLDKGGYLTGLAVLDPKGTEILVAFSGGENLNGGIYRSADGGKTWADHSAGLPKATNLFGSGWGCLPNLVTVGDMVYAGTSQGLYASHKKGKTWWMVLPQKGEVVRTLAVDSHRPDWVWAGTYNGLHVSRDQGKTFTRVGPKEMLWVQGVAVDPFDSKRWFAAVCQPWYGSFDNSPGIYMTPNDGKTWSRLSDSPCKGLEAHIVCDPHRRGVFYVGMNGTGNWRGEVKSK